ncbi:DUF4040 domain-containing protein [Vibrio sp. JPW-9-11-11]|uniref:hydrogen gas-evolving membrane-bound hydrogenase subunit E n=1 Tax=Vibrio sp. JPW-9-11-11 TaxID=1416532 RepID=UPI001593A328|nr:hydrogen gas-evolving membrane-bound hydrogenase subunit E [Vibrio sp. JPW-9-11-11]NVD08672.1 DUF4040 domain-containing protein [Vibrio sp. JPW-9-11-11]
MNHDKQYALLLFALVPAILFIALVAAYSSSGARYQVDWVPSLDIAFALHLDGLSMLFAGLITGIGCLIQLYAWSYMRSYSGRFSFHLYLTLFMLAMLGVVLSDNVLLLFVFWELTTITSYLLIGFNHNKSVSRKNALQALLVTGSGGLALLAGLILLGTIADSFQLAIIIERAPSYLNHPAFIPSLVLVLCGALTKSAQFPFHFWLPNAMAAPTPVSAYLHSATMVKAGIYLLARLSPVYSTSELWFWSLTCIGAATAIWCALVALKQTDLKLMLAYSTNVALGKLTLLLGLGTELALVAALIFVLAHSFYKAALFMVIGNIDRAMGTRELAQVSGLRSVLLLSFIAAFGAALSKAGLPPMLGFISKEYMYKAALEMSIWPSLALLVVNATMVVMALVILIKPFLGAANTHGDTAPKPVERDYSAWAPALLLALASLFVPVLALSGLSEALLISGVRAMAPMAIMPEVKLWHGLNAALMLSLITLALGVLGYRYYTRLTSWLAAMTAFLPSADRSFDQVIKAMMTLANWQTQQLQRKRLTLYVALFLTVLAALLLNSVAIAAIGTFQSNAEVSFYQVAIALLMVVAVGVVVVSRSRLLSVASLGVVGFLSTLVFMIFSAPDVAKTLLLVETLMVIFVAILMRHLPKLDRVVSHSKQRRGWHALVAVVIGGSISLVLIAITAQPIDAQLSDFFAQNSVPGGFGRNIVNVILVDFRAFDTLGEVVVVVIAGLAAVSLLPQQNRYINRIQSLIFTTTAHIVATLMLLFSFYLLLRGHNAPGGGFIGALVAVLGLSLLMLAETPNYVQRRLQFAPFNLALFGIALSLCAGVIGLLSGQAFLTGLWWKEILPLGTPLLFDVGIYLAVIGGVMGMMLRVNQELD